MTQEEAGQKECIWIFGGGKFGLRAVHMLLQKYVSAKLVVVDAQKIDGLPDSVVFVEGDAVEWLVENLLPNTPVTKIVPAVPLHLAAKWLEIKLTQMGIAVKPMALRDELLRKLPNPYRLSTSQAAISYADVLCPANCVEPDGYCTSTGEKRDLALYCLLSNLQHSSIEPIIIPSRQFAAGVGGVYPVDLWNLLKRVTVSPRSQLIIGTACKCHGIIDGLIHGSSG